MNAVQLLTQAVSAATSASFCEGFAAIARDASSSDDVQVGDVLEVADIAGSDAEAELQSSGPDQQILERNGDSLFSLLAFDAAGKLGSLHGHRMQGHVANEFIDERLLALPPCARRR